MRTRLLCALVLAGALVAFTGCGGSDKKSSSSSSSTTASTTGGSSGTGSLADYKAGLSRVGTEFQSSVQAALTKVAAGQTPSAKLAALDALKAAATKAADDFAALKPPSNLKADNDQLATELRSFASIIDEEKAAFQKNDKAALAAVGVKIRDVQSRITQTIATLESKIGK